MSTYFVSFTLEDTTVGGRDYNARWGDIYDAIHAISTRYWESTAAFIAFESDEAIRSVTQAVKDAIAPTTDTALIRSMDAKEARIVGVILDEDIFQIMPYLKRG
tara:strand:+ start:3459 stop:3770 length:312 start_codon:yes stop_codon:yes gene_type:complete